MAFPTCDRLVERQPGGCVGIEYARCGALRFGQFFLDLFSSDGPSPCLDGGTFDQMLQFSHIAWEGIALQGHDGIGGKPDRGNLIAFGVARKKILRQREYVGLTFPQRWETNGKGIETIEQVGSKGLLLHIVLQGTVRSGDYPNIGMDGSRSAYPLKGVLLQNTQELGLKGQR